MWQCFVECSLLTTAYCLVVVLGSGLDLVYRWSCVRIYTTFRCLCYSPVYRSISLIEVCRCAAWNSLSIERRISLVVSTTSINTSRLNSPSCRALTFRQCFVIFNIFNCPCCCFYFILFHAFYSSPKSCLNHFILKRFRPRRMEGDLQIYHDWLIDVTLTCSHRVIGSCCMRYATSNIPDVTALESDTIMYRVAPKLTHFVLYALTSSNIDRFSNLCHC